MTVRILKGDCREMLRTLPDESVHCVVTSPPYWGLRDYGVAGQLGMEPSLGEHVDTMVSVFAEVRRVLRDDGTLWLNYGDSYATSPNGRPAADVKALGNDDRTFRDKPFSTIGPIYRGKRDAKRWGGGNNWDATLKPKDLCGIPWRVALALQADGWWLRQDIIWSKPNPMPESVKDRCTKAHEYIFLMSKNQHYHYDAEAIAEPVTASTIARLGQDVDSQRGSDRVPGKTNGRMKAVPPKFGWSKYGNNDAPEHRTKSGNEYDLKDGKRNRRSVWEVATQPFSDAHFATFPPALIEPCILAGCPKGGIVLDLFGGAGTTGLVADRLGRDALLIELNPDYAEMAERRIRGDAGMFAEVHSCS